MTTIRSWEGAHCRAGGTFHASDDNEGTGNFVVDSSADVSRGDGIRITSADAVPGEGNQVWGSASPGDETTKTPRYGLNIAGNVYP
ncbi:hypothetical protein RMN56_26265 [Micromonospora halotolerans]|uniref:Pectate lyase n=1 Tax=Micromonospora halotolerans TaxID=709879 RepID=A0ABY9ZUN4_9ACTN|nr:hypothetical protein [Micromonospora halotolerans]WNM38607.1 hypothetical protein RMN56_26265 [Micromonospora halotolerans]